MENTLTPRFDGYHHGDIVVFSPPAGWAHNAAGTPYIKRVIGVAGDLDGDRAPDGGPDQDPMKARRVPNARAAEAT